MTLRLHTQSTEEIAFKVKAGSFDSYKFVVPLDPLNVTLQGHFSVEGRVSNDIEVLVLNEDDYVSWQNGYTTFRFYDSGRVTQGDICVSLLSDLAGTYYVVFNNKFSLGTDKAIKANMRLNYYTTSWGTE